MRPRWIIALAAASTALAAASVVFAQPADDQRLYATLTRWLDSPNGPKGKEARDVAAFLAERRHVAAYPVIARRLREAPPGEGAAFAEAMLALGVKHAVGPVITRMADLRERDGAARDEVLQITTMLASLGRDVRVDYAAYRAALPERLTERDMRAVITLARARRELAAADDLVAILLEPRLRADALGVLVTLDAPDTLKRARVLVEALRSDGMLDEPAYRQVSSTLDERLARR